MSLGTLEKDFPSGLEGLTSSPVPWKHFAKVDFLARPAADALVQAANVLDLKRHEADRKNKPYKLYNARLPTRFDHPDRDWQRIANVLQSSEYREAIGRLTELDLSRCPVTLNMWAYGPGDLLGPHRDDPNKILTQVLYLNPEWRPRDGGRLALLTGDTMESAVRHVLPSHGATVIFSPSDHSWHAVEPITASSPMRLSLSLNYWREGTDTSR
jgi:Rps23 Pro-64 3,4-dihydroxylase Tpa1-like proline 4-hydroxylase